MADTHTPATLVNYLLATTHRMLEISPEMWIGAEERI